MANEREAEQADIGQQALRQLHIIHAQVPEPGGLPGLPLIVGAGTGAEALDEATQLPRRDGLLPQVDEVDLDAALLEVAKSGLGRPRVHEAEHLDLGCGRGGHGLIVARSRRGGGRKRECRSAARPRARYDGTATRGGHMSAWFTVRLDDRPGSLARAAQALANRGVNITGIVGVAEDTDGELMITTSDAAATREALAALGVVFEEHDPTDPHGLASPGSLADMARTLADR